MFRQISFAIVDAVTQDPVIGAEVYVDHVGYIENGGTAIVPLGSTIYCPEDCCVPDPGYKKSKV